MAIRREMLAALLATATSSIAFSQTVQYRKIEVGGRVSITVPAHWRVRDEAERRNIGAAADALLDPKGQSAEPMHVSALSVVSTPEPPQAIVRVSFVPDVGSQEELQQELRQGKSKLVAELAASWREESKALADALAKQGMRYLGYERFDVLQFGSKLAIMISYRRSSARGGSPYVVTQYHVPMGADKVLVTISLQESGKPLLGPVLDRVKNSVTVRG